MISGSARCQAAGTGGSGQTGPTTCLPALGRNAIHPPVLAQLPQVVRRGQAARLGGQAGAGELPGSSGHLPMPGEDKERARGHLGQNPSDTAGQTPGDPEVSWGRREAHSEGDRARASWLQVSPSSWGVPFSGEQPSHSPGTGLQPQAHSPVSLQPNLGCPGRPRVCAQPLPGAQAACGQVRLRSPLGTWASYKDGAPELRPAQPPAEKAGSQRVGACEAQGRGLSSGGDAYSPTPRGESCAGVEWASHAFASPIPALLEPGAPLQGRPDSPSETPPAPLSGGTVGTLLPPPLSPQGKAAADRLLGRVGPRRGRLAAEGQCA